MPTKTCDQRMRADRHRNVSCEPNEKIPSQSGEKWDCEGVFFFVTRRTGYIYL